MHRHVTLTGAPRVCSDSCRLHPCPAQPLCYRQSREQCFHRENSPDPPDGARAKLLGDSHAMEKVRGVHVPSKHAAARDPPAAAAALTTRRRRTNRARRESHGGRTGGNQQRMHRHAPPQHDPLRSPDPPRSRRSKAPARGVDRWIGSEGGGWNRVWLMEGARRARLH